MRITVPVADMPVANEVDRLGPDGGVGASNMDSRITMMTQAVLPIGTVGYRSYLGTSVCINEDSSSKVLCVVRTVAEWGPLNY